MPLVTYITVVRNGVEEIDRTIQSILPFLSSQVEYIIIDGESTDGTVEKIKAYTKNINWWVSQKDKGIYDAMNTGLKMARGEFVCFINIGDELVSCPIRQLQLALQKDAAAISFPVQLSNGKIFFPSFSGKIKLENTLHHQGTYYRKSKVSKYDLSFKTFADFDQNQNLYKSDALVMIDHSVVNSIHRVNGISNSKSQFQEIFRVVRKNYGFAYSIFSLLYFKLKYGLASKLRSKAV